MTQKKETVEGDSIIARSILSDRELWPWGAAGYHFKERSEAERFAGALRVPVVDRRALSVGAVGA
jgi:hypothetical protein